MKRGIARASLAQDVPAPAYTGLELLSTAVLVVGAAGRVRWLNQSAEAMLDLPQHDANAVDRLLDEALAGAFTARQQAMLLRRPLRPPLQVQAIATASYQDETPLL